MVTQGGVRRRQIDAGPWQPYREMATQWARYLESTGNYDQVEIQSNGRAQDDGAAFLDGRN